jgi:hypothetical protein
VGGAVTSLTKHAGGSGYTTAAILIDAPGGGSQDAGTCTCPNSTQIVVTPLDSTKTWPANYWDQTDTGRKAVADMDYNIGTDVDAKFTAMVIANTALTGGGTSTLTLDRPMPTTNYTSYSLCAQAGGGSIVYRRYKITNAAMASLITDDQWTFAKPFISSNGQAATLSSFNCGVIEWSASGLPPYVAAPIAFTVDPTAGTVDLVVPSVCKWGTPAKLKAGGAAVDGIPTNVRLMIGVRKGQLIATCPPDSGSGSAATPQYQGTAYTVRGIERTLTVTVPGWRDSSNQAGMDAYACDILDSVKDEITEGTVPYLGFYEAAATPGAALTLKGSAYTFALDSMAIPILECRLKIPIDNASNCITELKVSSRRAHFTGQVYLRPTPTGFMLGTDSGVFTAGMAYTTNSGLLAQF